MFSRRHAMKYIEQKYTYMNKLKVDSAFSTFILI